MTTTSYHVMNNTVIIVTYNRKALLKECIAHALAQTLPFAQVVVIDNCSTDGTEEVLAPYEADPRFVIRRMASNLGGAGGFAAGLELVRGQQTVWDYVLVIDDDAMIAPDYMERICDYGGRHPEVPGFAGRVVVDGKTDPYHRRRLASRLLFYESMLKEADYERDGARCDCATFCGFALRGQVLRDIGVPKAAYFLWYDDTEYTLRLAGRGGIAVLGSAVLDHRTVLAQETKGLLERITWRQYYGYRNRHDTARIHAGRLSACCVRAQYQLFRALSALMTLSPDAERRTQGKYNMRLLTDVLADCRSGRLGRREEYRP